MSVRVIGKCSLCGGRVTVPIAWWSVVPPVPTCERCGAVADTVIPMKPRPNPLGPGCHLCGAIGAHFCTGGQKPHPGWVLRATDPVWNPKRPVFK